MVDISSECSIAFGPFILLPQQRLLLDSGKAVRLGGRALGLLTALVERAGEVVSKDDLIKRVWPNTTVEESNLKVHVGNLRRILRDGLEGSRYIVNVSGRGYSFVGAISVSEVSAIASRSTPPLRGMPQVLTQLVGREEAIGSISSLIARRRLVTVVGPGGIGKTTVALAVAHNVHSFEDGRIFADLAPLSDPLLLPSFLSSLLGVVVHLENPIPTLARFPCGQTRSHRSRQL